MRRIKYKKNYVNQNHEFRKILNFVGEVCQDYDKILINNKNCRKLENPSSIVCLLETEYFK